MTIYNALIFNGLGRGCLKRAGTDARFKREQTQVISVRLSPASIFLLNQLSTEHGGAGRAIQIAVELLAARKKPIELQEEDESKPKEIFSFAAFPRTRALMNRLGVRHYETQANVIRACIQQLYELREDATIIGDLYGRNPKDDSFLG